MSWAKVNKPFSKPLKFWYHKIHAEYYYAIDNIDYYCYHLREILNMGYTIYGEEI